MVPFENFKEGHILHLSSIQDEACIARCRESFDRQAVLKDDFVQRVQDCIAGAEEVLQLKVQVSPEDSIDEVGSRSASKSSRVSKGSSHSGSRRSSVSHRSGASSLSAARAKGAACVVELRAEAAAFSEHQFLEKRKFLLKEEERRVTLETEIAKSQAREQALAPVKDPKPCVVPLGLLYSGPCLANSDQVNVNLNPQSVAVKSNPRVCAPNLCQHEQCWSVWSV